MSSATFAMPGGMQFGTPFSWNAILSSSSLNKSTQAQLARVYLALSGTVLAASAGAYSLIKWGLFADSSLPFILSMVVMMALSFTPPSKSNENLRLGMLLTFGFLDGCLLGPLISMAIQMNPTILVNALLSTAIVFVSFSVSALMATRRSFLYLGGILGSTLTFMMFASFMNIFFRSTFVPWMNIYLGLVVFCGFILFDTQLMLEQIAMGNKDHIMQALNLFVDLVAVFVRILIILMKNSEKEDDRKRTRR